MNSRQAYLRFILTGKKKDECIIGHLGVWDDVADEIWAICCLKLTTIVYRQLEMGWFSVECVLRYDKTMNTCHDSVTIFTSKFSVCELILPLEWA